MISEKLLEYIKDGKLNDKLLDIYHDSEQLKTQAKRYSDSVAAFMGYFPDNEDLSVFSAPGRTEVGGNHTDHQHGHVLAASINLDAIAVASKNSSDLVNIKSEGYDLITLNINELSKSATEEGTTLALVKGVIAGCRNKGYQIGGFNAYITSDVIGGSGLSSSAAFETLIGCIISGLYNDMSIDAVTNACIGQYAENHYFGKPCGLMDQMACSVGSLSHIDFNAPDSEPVIERIDFDLDKAGYSLCITDTKGSHADLTDDYAAVPKEMKQLAGYFGKDYLIDVDEDTVIKNIPELRKQLGDRAVLRALHFYEENKRVIGETEALKTGNISDFLHLVKASGDSSYKYLQNVYTTHDTEHQNISIALCISQMILGEDGGVCRVHGGGFAGTIQAFVKKERVNEYKKALDNIFGENACAVLRIRKYGGVQVI